MMEDDTPSVKGQIGVSHSALPCRVNTDVGVREYGWGCGPIQPYQLQMVEDAVAKAPFCSIIGRYIDSLIPLLL